MKIKIKKIENGKLPEYKTDGASGADCYARIEKDIILNENDAVTVPLGFAVEIPDGYEMQIRPRSGLARKNKTVAILGTIDSDYRGEVGATIINHSKSVFIIKPNDRIAQAVVCPVIRAEWYLTDELSETERGEGGFGSTGVSEVKVSYPHKVEKFYEPFTKELELEEYLGKDVVIDNKLKGRLNGFYYLNGFIKLRFVILRNNLETEDTYIMDAASAFERVKIDGHRFGKEIEFE